MQNLEKYNNSDYKPGNTFVRVSWYFLSLFFFESKLPWPYFLKKFFLKLYGAKVGKKFIIKPKVKIKYPWKLRCGDNVWIGEDCWIDNLSNVIIEDNVCISQGALLICGNHDYKKETFNLITNEIIIEKGVWICAKAVVSAGVTCREGSILTIGSVATKDIKKNAIYKGNPAQYVKERRIK